jgi:tetratricopeptide (TPR) repeat protein
LTTAATHYQEGLDLIPNYPDLLTAMGALRGVQGRFDEAIHYLEKAVEQNPDHVNAGTYLQEVRKKREMQQRRSGLVDKSAVALQDASLERCMKAGDLGVAVSKTQKPDSSYPLLEEEPDDITERSKDKKKKRHRKRKRDPKAKRSKRKRRRRKRYHDLSEDSSDDNSLTEDSEKSRRRKSKRKHRRKEQQRKRRDCDSDAASTSDDNSRTTVDSYKVNKRRRRERRKKGPG